MARLEGRRGPQLEWIDRLDVVVPVEQHRRLALCLHPVGIEDGMPRRLDDLRILESDSFVLLREMAGRAPDVVGALRLARDAGDPEKVVEFLEPLVAGSFKEFFRRRHCWRDPS